jgi:NADH dehydrogenase [ubiquinone] 1 alpha subcomplex assembly factor 7
MRAMQKEKLRYPNKGRLELIWHDSVYDLPRNSGVYNMLIAHEFFDALPVHVVQVKCPK